jgi:serine/threonine protein kinase
MNVIKAQVEEAILNLAPSVSIGSSVTYDEVKGIIRIFMRKHPEIFWFSHKYTYNKAAGILKLYYNFTKEKVRFINGEIEKVLKKDFQVDYVRALSESEKLVYVYKWIAKRTTYNEYSSYNQTIYSVLINRNSVCTGYAKTAQYLLSQVGINSRLVYGKFNYDKTEFGRHGWNVVQINGLWYHVDFCLADVSLSNLINKEECPNLRDSLLWNYFGVSTKKILTNRTIEDIETIPNCELSLHDIPNVALKMPTERLICCKSDSGSTSMVYLDSFDKNMVVKVLRDNQYNLIKNEDAILRQLSGSKHIVQLINATDTELVLEQLTPWGELLNSTYYNPTESDLQSIIHQLVSGLIECKQKGICYSDIHYNNVFVSNEGIYKWGDFGLAFTTQNWDYLPNSMLDNEIPKGSQWFMAPETCNSGFFDEASAIYAVSMMAYFVMNDMRPPFWSGVDHQIEALTLRLNGREIPMPKNADRYQSLWQSVSRNLSFDRNRRAHTFKEFLSQLHNNTEPEGLTIIGPCNESSIEDHIDGCSIDMFARTAVYPGISRDLSMAEDDSNDILIDDCSNEMFARTAAFPGISKDLSLESDDSENRQHPILEQTPKDIEYSFRPLKSSSANECCQDKYESHRAHQVQSSRSFLKRFKDLFIKPLKNCEDKNDLENFSRPCIVNACVYAPAQIQASKSFIIRVYLYKPEETDSVDTKEKEIDPNARRKEYKPLDLPVKRGDMLTVQLQMSDGICLDKNLKSLYGLFIHGYAYRRIYQ